MHLEIVIIGSKLLFHGTNLTLVIASASHHLEIAHYTGMSQTKLQHQTRKILLQLMHNTCIMYEILNREVLKSALVM